MHCTTTSFWLNQVEPRFQMITDAMVTGTFHSFREQQQAICQYWRNGIAIANRSSGKRRQT